MEFVRKSKNSPLALLVLALGTPTPVLPANDVAPARVSGSLVCQYEPLFHVTAVPTLLMYLQIPVELSVAFRFLRRYVEYVASVRNM